MGRPRDPSLSAKEWMIRFTLEQEKALLALKKDYGVRDFAEVARRVMEHGLRRLAGEKRELFEKEDRSPPHPFARRGGKKARS